jgi:4-amino-4-deoxy-L-arabinose transferase-like glycosyltransferase
VLWLSLALGFLAKGPVAWAVPGVTLLLFRFAFWRRPLPWSRLGLAWGLPLMLALAGAWGVPALLRTDGLFWSQGMHRHVVQRGLKAFDGRLFLPLVYYPATVLISLYPWSAWAGRAWVRTRRHWDLPAAFLAAWFLAPMLVFSFYATQLPHYVLPGFAAFLLLAFRGAPETEEYPRWTAVFGRAVALAPAAAACVVLLPAGWLALRGGPAWPLGLAGGAALAVAALAFWVRGGPDVPRRAVLAAALVGAALAACAALVRAQDPVVRMKEIFARLPPGARCIAWGFREPSLVYYSGRTWTFPRTVPDLAAALKQPGPQCVVLMRDETGLLRFLRRGPADRGAARPAWAGLDLRGYDRCEAEGLNTARGTWVRCDLLVRPPSPATRAAPE